MITAAILAALADGPALAVDLAARTGLAVPATEAVLYALRRAGRVESFPSPTHVVTWRLTAPKE